MILSLTLQFRTQTQTRTGNTRQTITDMKKVIRIVAAAATAAVLATACGSTNKSNVKVDAELPSKAETDSVSYLIGVNFGAFIKNNGFGEDLNYSEMKAGMMDFLNATGNMYSPEFGEQLKINPDQMNRLFRDFIGKMGKYEAAVNKAEGAEFMKANKMKEGVVTTDSGLQYKIIESGNEAVKAGPEDTVFVHYKGTLIDGTEFDASDPEKEPVKMLLNRVIKGWTEGLQLVGEGGRIQLFVPDSLAYGPRGTRGIGPNSTLIFDITVEKVNKVPAEPETEKDGGNGAKPAPATRK